MRRGWAKARNNNITEYLTLKSKAKHPPLCCCFLLLNRWVFLHFTASKYFFPIGIFKISKQLLGSTGERSKPSEHCMLGQDHSKPPPTCPHKGLADRWDMKSPG